MKVIPCFKHKGSLGELKIAPHFCKNLVQFRGQLRGKRRFVKIRENVYNIENSLDLILVGRG